VDGDNIAMLDPEVVTDNSVEAGAAVIKLIIGKYNQDGVLPLLAPNQDGIATEELESLHGVVRQGDNRIVIVDGIGNPTNGQVSSIRRTSRYRMKLTSAGWASSSS
jgi:hypothetical protein